MKIKFIIIFIALFFGVILNAQDNSSDLSKKFPNPPEGFTWKSLSEIKGYLLIPAGWYFNYEKEGDTHAYFFTKENYKITGQYITGVSINAVTNLKNINPKKYLKEYIKQLEQTVKIISKSKETKFGPFSQYIIRCTVYSKKLKKNIKMHIVLIANLKTNCLYFIIFETLEELWDINWQKGKVILRDIGINNKF